MVNNKRTIEHKEIGPHMTIDHMTEAPSITFLEFSTAPLTPLLS